MKKRKKMIKSRLTDASDTKQVEFCSEIEIPELKLYARHGQDLDSMNNTAANRLNKGDLLNFMAFRLSKIVVDEIAKLHSRFSGQATKLINEFQQQVERISNFRPLPSFWLYMDMLVRKYSSKAKDIKGLPDAIVQVGNNFYNGFHQIASNKLFVQQFEALYFPLVLRKLLNQLPLSVKERSLRSRAIQKFITHSAAKLHDWFSTNKQQFEEAVRMIAGNPDINVVTFGHTDRQSNERGNLLDLTGRIREFKFVNSGSWTNSVYASPVAGSNGEIRFLREQKNSGVLTVEYDGVSDAATFRTSFYETDRAKLGLRSRS